MKSLCRSSHQFLLKKHSTSVKLLRLHVINLIGLGASLMQLSTKKHLKRWAKLMWIYFNWLFCILHCGCFSNVVIRKVVQVTEGWFFLTVNKSDRQKRWAQDPARKNKQNCKTLRFNLTYCCFKCVRYIEALLKCPKTMNWTFLTEFQFVFLSTTFMIITCYLNMAFSQILHRWQ